MQWALLAIFILFLILAYIVIQGTRAAIAWRKAADAGDVKVIRDIVEDAISAWRSMKRPTPVAHDVWRGIQSMQIVDVAAELVRVSCQAESEYKLVGGRWLETTNPLQEGMSITAKAADMLLYELPHYKPPRVQIDIYTSFREPNGQTRRACILSTSAPREEARGVDWEEWTPDQIVDALGGRYKLGDSGQPLAIEVAPPQPEAKAAANGTGTPVAS